MHWPKLLSTAQAMEYSGLTLVELDSLADAGLVRFIVPLKQKRKFVRRTIDAYFEKEGITWR
jgi:hypothetical protein